MLYKLDIKTNERVQFLNITGDVLKVILQSGIETGMCYLFVPHTTAAVMVNENADPDVMTDIAAGLDRSVPLHADYWHAEGNSAAHIKAVMVGHTETLFIENRSLVLGTWQGIFFAEFDGPRTRKLYIKIIED